MKISVEINLSNKQETAFLKRVTGGTTPESLAVTIVTELSQKWADEDYAATALSLSEALKDKPQTFLMK